MFFVKVNIPVRGYKYAGYTIESFIVTEESLEKCHERIKEFLFPMKEKEIEREFKENKIKGYFDVYIYEIPKSTVIPLDSKVKGYWLNLVLISKKNKNKSIRF